MEFFAKTFEFFNSKTNFVKRSILDAWQDPKYASEMFH